MISGAVLKQYGYALIASLCSIIAASWLVWPSSAIGPMMRGELFPNITHSQIATTVALMDLGCVISPIPASYLINIVGRTTVIHFTAIIFTATSLLTIFAQNMWFIYLARLLAGMGKGIAFGVIPVYLTEIAQINMRGTLGSLFGTGVSSGTTYGYVIGAYLNYQGMNNANLIIAGVFFVTAWALPETPFYIFMKGDDKAAEKCLTSLRCEQKGSTVIRAEMDQIKKTVESCSSDRARFIDIATSKSRRRALLIVVVASLIQRSSGISPILAYGNSILPPGGGWLRSEEHMIIFSVILSVGNYIGALLTEHTGRKVLLMYSSMFNCIANLLFAVFYSLQTSGADVSGYTWVPYFCLHAYAVSWSLGLGIMAPFLPAELFPNNVKSYASSISSLTLGITSFGLNKVFGEVYQMNGGVEAMFFFFAVSCFFFCIFCHYYVIETKGKTLQEIQIILEKETGERK